MSDGLAFYVITGPNTSDFPGVFTLRRQVVMAGGIVIDKEPIGHAPTLEEIRRLVPPGLTRIGRWEGDDPVIVESWL